jgi:hypothetical protein
LLFLLARIYEKENIKIVNFKKGWNLFDLY